MNPSEAKAKQKKRYNEIAVLVANGRLGYIPANKSRFSKSSSNKFAQDISFN